MHELENFKLILAVHPKDIGKFADLLDIVVIDLKEDNRTGELGNATFYRKLQKKLPERMIKKYQRWVFDKEKKENVENLRSLIIQRPEFHRAAPETIHGLHRIGNKAKIDHINFGLSHNQMKVNTKRSVYSAV